MPKYSRRHYEDAAAILNKHVVRTGPKVSHYDPIEYASVLAIIRDFADLFQQDNPQFDRDRFRMACGVIIK